MSLSTWQSLTRRLCSLGCASILAAGFAHAQSIASNSQSDSSGWSSSQSSSLEVAGAAVPGRAAALPAAPAPSASAAPQGSENSGWHARDAIHHLTFELGGGFNAPIGNDTPYITWGANFTGGAGVRFSPMVSTLLEYQFIDDKLPGALIAAAGTTSGDSHISSITASPVIDLTPKRSNGVYLVGGYGYYHKSTNFNEAECCAYDFYGEYYVNVTVASFTSNQWGGNAGLGLYHRLGGMYGDGKSQLFAESRYTFIHTPPISQANGLGTTELIPVTFGIRW